MEKLIDIDHVTAAYGNKTVLRDISLTIWKDDKSTVVQRIEQTFDLGLCLIDLRQ